MKQKDVPARIVPNWPQLAVKHVYDEAIMLPNVANYLPEPSGNGVKRLPERDFFWKVIYCLHPDFVDSKIQQAQKKKMSREENLQEQKWAVGVSKEWLDQLTLHDFTSSK